MSYQNKSKRSFSKRDFYLIKKRFNKIYANLVKFEVGTSYHNISKLGITVSKKFGNAVARNRFKRLVREAFRKNIHSLPKGSLVHVIPKAHAKIDYQSIILDFQLMLDQYLAHAGSSSESST